MRRASRRHLFENRRHERRRPLWRKIWDGIGLWARRLCLLIGAAVLVGMLGGLLARLFVDSDVKLPPHFILTANFTGAFNEHPNRLAFFAPPEEDFYRVLSTLRAGAKDPHVKSLFVQIWNGTFSVAQIREIRAVLNDWRAAGKPTYAFAYSLGDGAMGLGSYWLATAFDKIWVQPTGMVTLNGLRAAMPFARDTLDRYGIVPEFFAYTTYKSAMDMFTQSRMRDADREQLSVMLNGLTDTFVTDVASARSLSSKTVRDLIAQAPFTAEEAQKLKLIDMVGYQDEVGARLQLMGGGADNAPFVALADYLPVAMNDLAQKAKGTEVALINLEGEITDLMTMPEDVQAAGPFSSSESCVSCALMTASEDDNIKAILLRINSPGGSPSASETIRRAILVARHKGKPVVVSMGDLAASGGYWVASAADQIIAQPTTLTGSIGVVGGKFAAKGLFERYGVHWDSVAANDVAPDIASFIDTMTPDGEARMKKLLGKTYEDFKARVAEGRRLKDVEAIAKGRIWLGSDASEIGLVDAIGGLDEAKNTLAVLLKLKSAGDLRVVAYAPTPSPFEGLRALMNLPRTGIEIVKWWNTVKARPPVEARAPLTETLSTVR